MSTSFITTFSKTIATDGDRAAWRLADKVGTLASGKQADMVVWSGAPFDATSKPVVVVAGGKVVFDGREKKK